MAQVATCFSCEAQVSNRSRAVFLLVQRIGTADPVLGSLPVDPEAAQRLPHGLDADGTGHPAQTNTLLDEQVERP